MIYKKRQKEAPFRPCDYPGCPEKGQFRAPKDRNLNSYYWFCLKHVTEYNKNWDFYQGLSGDEIEQHIQNDMTWQRPTWKLGQNQTFRRMTENLHDLFGFFNEEELGMSGKYNPPRTPDKTDKKLAAAIKFLEVSFPLNLTEVKKQFKKLAKKYHPDANGGDNKNEALFKELLDHYRYLTTYLSSRNKG